MVLIDDLTLCIQWTAKRSFLHKYVFISFFFFALSPCIYGASLSSHSDVKTKKSNSECKMSRRNAVFELLSRRNAVSQFGMQNVKV